MANPQHEGNPTLADSILPRAVPFLDELTRVPEAGVDTRQYIGLDRNERVSPMPDWFMEEIRQSVSSELLNWYPTQDAFHSQLQAVLGLPEERIILAPSSDAAFKNLYQAYLNPRDRVVMLEPSYAMFPVYAQMFGAESVQITYNRDMRLDTEHLLSSITSGVKLVMLANPNQPTGTLLEDDIILEVLKRAAAVGALVAMDEAYYPFTQSTALPWVEDHPNLLVIRTFSKASGLAGLRLGFVAAHPEVVTNLYKVRSVNDLNSMSVLCASKVLEHPVIVDDYVAEVKAGEKVLAEETKSIGLEQLPTNASFALLRVGHRCSPADLVEALMTRGYLIKGPFGSECVADCVRVTLGPPDVMKAFAQALREVMESEFPI